MTTDTGGDTTSHQQHPATVGKVSAPNGQAIGINYGQVLQQRFSGPFRLLRHATIPLDPLPGDLRLADPADPDNPVARFRGREEIIRRIDAFLERCVRQRRGGLILVEAEAGMGKSALAAYLAFTRVWPAHFTRLADGRDPRTARRNLAAQLIARWQLDDAAPGGILPDDADTTAWLYGRLCDAARTRDRDPHETSNPVVLLVDGLDEVPLTLPGELPLGLPPSLPPGTVIVASTRPNTVAIPAGSPVVERIDVESASNRQDLLDYLTTVTTHDPELIDALRRAGIPAGRFCRTLLDRSGGVWIHALTVLDQIREHNQNPADVGAVRASAAPAPRTETALSGTRAGVVATEPVLRPSGGSVIANGLLSARRVRGLVPENPPSFLPRESIVAEVRTRLCTPGQSMAMAGLIGMAGAGKSTLARAIAADPAVLELFPGGAVWIDAGPDVEPVECASRLIAAVGSTEPVTDVGSGRRILERILADTGMLVIVDDVWTADQVRAVDVPVVGGALLVTSRDADVVDPDDVVEVSVLDQDQSRQVLAGFANCAVDDLPADATAVAIECGGLPLALATAGGMVREGRRWESVLARLRQADLNRLRNRFRHYPYPDLLKALDASVTALDEPIRRRFDELAVFEKRGRVPAETVAWLWSLTAGVDDLDSEDLVVFLASRSLIQFDVTTRTLTLHDLLFDYIRANLGPDRIRILHGRLARSYMELWGGVAAGFPRLWKTADAAPTHMYGVTNLVAHLTAGGEQEAVHSLLAAGRETPGATQANLWYATCERFGYTATFLADVRAAWKLAEHQTDAALTAGEKAPSLVLELRYMLVAASVASIAANIPPNLLALLVQRGIWLPQQAFFYARSIPDDFPRAMAIKVLAPHLSSDLLAEAMQVIATLNPAPQTYALCGIAPHLSNHLLSIALATARSMIDPNEKARAMAGLAPHLPQELAAVAIDQVLRLEDVGAKATALIDLAQHASQDDRQLILDAAASAARVAAARGGDDDCHESATALFRISTDLTDAERPTIHREALAVARQIKDPETKAATLASLAPHLPAETSQSVLSEALSEIPKIEKWYKRGSALSDLADQLPDTLIPEALLLVPTLHDTMKDDALAAFPRLSGDHLRQAQIVAQDIAYDSGRAKALAALTEHLPDSERRSAISEAVLIAQGAGPTSSFRAGALAFIAGYAPDDMRPAILHHALDAVREAKDPERDAAVYLSVAEQISPEQCEPVIKAALATIARIEYAQGRSRMVKKTVPHLSPPLPVDTMAVEALASSRIIGGTGEYSKAVAALGNLLPTGERQTLVADALAAVWDIYEPLRTDALSALASHLTESHLKTAPDHILTTGTSWGGRLIATMTPFMPEDVARSTLSRIDSIEDPLDRGDALIALATALPTTDRTHLLSEAHQIALATEQLHERMWMLTKILPVCSASQRANMIDEALATARAFLDPHERAGALASVVAHMPTDKREPLVAEAFKAALEPALEDDPSGRYSRGTALAELAPHLSADLLPKATTLAMTIDEPMSLARCLARLGPHLPGPLLSDVLSTIEGIDPWLAHHAIAALAASLKPEHLPQALTIALTFDHAYEQAYAIRGLAPHLPAELLPTVKHAARVLKDTQARASALTALLGAGPAGWSADWRAAALAASTSDRAVALELVEAAAETVSMCAGDAGVLDLFGALRDVRCWFP